MISGSGGRFYLSNAKNNDNNDDDDDDDMRAKLDSFSELLRDLCNDASLVLLTCVLTIPCYSRQAPLNEPE